jgi:hypothetical protein
VQKISPSEIKYLTYVIIVMESAFHLFDMVTAVCIEAPSRASNIVSRFLCVCVCV